MIMRFLNSDIKLYIKFKEQHEINRRLIFIGFVILRELERLDDRLDIVYRIGRVGD